jgi:hypothetical protein
MNAAERRKSERAAERQSKPVQNARASMESAVAVLDEVKDGNRAALAEGISAARRILMDAINRAR